MASNVTLELAQERMRERIQERRQHTAPRKLSRPVNPPTRQSDPPAPVAASGFVWDRGQTLALARHGCQRCMGLGLTKGRGMSYGPCGCVLRAIFRACYAQYWRCARKPKWMSHATLDMLHGTATRYSWGRPNEEYCADFVLVSKRTLSPESWKVFDLHFLLGADWRFCTRRLGMDRGNFFHEVYRIEHQLGRVFRELRPYSLFPFDEYFCGHGQFGPVGLSVIRPGIFAHDGRVHISAMFSQVQADFGGGYQKFAEAQETTGVNA
jgi:hypothetical protein